MDLTTLVGLLAGGLILIQAVWQQLADVYHGPTLLLTLGGGLAATLVAFRSENVGILFALLKQAVVSKGRSASDLVNRIVGLGETARLEGIRALEEGVKTVGDPFLVTGIRLAVDGTEPRLIQVILETEVSFIEERHRQGHRLLKVLGINWLVFGVATGAGVLALRSGVVSGADLVSEAALPVLYGLVLSGLIAFPFRWKLQSLSEAELLTRRMIVEGVMSIQSGDNPRIIEQKLNVFLAPRQRARYARPLPEPKADQPLADPDLQEQTGEVVHQLQAAFSDPMAQAPEEWTLDHLIPLADEEGRREVLKALGEPFAPPGKVLPMDFEGLTRLTDREMQLLFREVDTWELAAALRGASQAVQDRAFKNVSDRVAVQIRAVMQSRRMQSVSARRVVDAQLRILWVVQMLVEHGQVDLGT